MVLYQIVPLVLQQRKDDNSSNSLLLGRIGKAVYRSNDSCVITKRIGKNSNFIGQQPCNKNGCMPIVLSFSPETSTPILFVMSK